MDSGMQHMNNKGNLSKYIFDLANKTPDKYAFIHPSSITYKELQTEIDQYVSGLLKIGVRKGDKVLLLVKPGPLMFIITFSLFRIAAIPVMIDPGMGANAMEKVLSKLDIDVFIGEPKAHLLRIFYPSTFKSVKHFVCTRKLFLIPTLSVYSLRSQNCEASNAVSTKSSDDAAIFFTSGSTGPAKAVLYKNSMLHSQIEILRDHFGYKADEVDCVTFPLTGLLVMCLGLSIVFADMNMTKPSTLKPKLLVQNINDYNCSHLFCSPMVLRKLAEYGNANNIKLPSLKRVMTAGAIVPPDLIQSIINLLSSDAEIHTPYGATEALPVTDITGKELLNMYSDDSVFSEGICIGYPIEGIEIRIIRISDEEIPDYGKIDELISNEIGEIIVNGSVVTQEYLITENPRMSKIWDDQINNYWHRMGDLGRKDAEGRIWYYGRKSQRVITNYRTLYTIPVEAIFNGHPEVFRSALVGVSNHNNEFKRPVICIQPYKEIGKKWKKHIISELIQLAKENDINIDKFIFTKDFPVDPRHNAKIYREKLAQWAQK